MNSESVVTALAALAQSSRLAVFRHLVVQGRTGASPGEISEQLGIPGATLSFHLKALQHAGLIGAEKSGRSIRYRANFTTMQALLDYLTLNCCVNDIPACALGCAPDEAAANPQMPASIR